MKRLGIVLLMTTLLFATVAPAAARHGGRGFHGHVFVGPLLAPLFLPFAVAGAITAGVAAAVTAPFAYPYATYPAPPVYAPPVYAGPQAYAGPPVYAAPPPPAPSYWYYCPSAGGYYPYVGACPGGWLTVVPR
jgi:hypothetical protein